jgi:hypothetical protein
LIWLGAVGITAVVCFGIAESSASRPGAWVLAGVSSITVLSIASAAWTLRTQHWLAAVVLAGLLAVTVSLAVFVTAAPATSRSCQSNTDCDTSFGLGLPFVSLALAPPALLLTSTGRALGRVRRRTKLSRPAP